MLKKIFRDISKYIPGNLLLDWLIKPVRIEDLRSLKNIKIEVSNLNFNDYNQWVNYFFPEWQNKYKDIRHKKLLEFYTSYTILAPKLHDVFCDVAGGIETYLPKLNCKDKFLQDISISPKIRDKYQSKVIFIEGDAGKINLPDYSLDKVSMHHSFEHFQNESDILFIREVQRLLKIGGLCCILPLFAGTRYAEITNIIDFKKKFDSQSKFIIDPTATIPGSEVSGNYARIYDLVMFEKRILSNIDFKRFGVKILEIKMNGIPVPDLNLSCHKKVSKINRPFRALVISRDK